MSQKRRKSPASTRPERKEPARTDLPADGRVPARIAGDRVAISSASFLWISAGLLMLVLVVFGQVYRFGFVNYDDPGYVKNCAQVCAGLTWESIRWAFTATDLCNWHPLTWLSLMLDVQMFGVNPGAHHVVNAAFHAANALLLFWILLRMTTASGPRALWPSAMVAALFAVHPLHVESVAWISERKDVLSTLFWLLTVAAYVRYVRRPGLTRYVPILVCFALGLAAKPMLVTLPAVLLLLDYWPLRRIGFDSMKDAGEIASSGWKPSSQRQGRSHGAGGDNAWFRSIVRLLVEKVPLFLLAGLSSVATMFAQGAGGGVVPFDVIPLSSRVGNALVAYMSYILLTVWPSGLAFYYPHARGAMPVWQPLAAGVVLAVVTGFVVWRIRRSPYLAVGWFWYLGTLLPVIGIIQVGDQALADRYTYVPLIGFFIAAVWGASDLAAKFRVPRAALMAAGVGVILALTVCAAIQTSYWRGSVTLFERALAVTTNNFMAHKALGVTLADEAHQYPEAEEHCRKAIALAPNDADVYYNLGNTLLAQERLDDALAAYRKAVKLKPDYVNAHNNLGNVLARQKKFAEAGEAFASAAKWDPNNVAALNNLGSAFVNLEKFEDALGVYQKTIGIDPGYLDAWCNLGYTLFRLGRRDEAGQAYKHALALDPQCRRAQDALRNLGVNP